MFRCFQSTFAHVLAVIDAGLFRFASFFVREEKRRISLSQFFKFLCTGAVNSLIDFGVYFFLTRYAFSFGFEATEIVLANSISFMLATTFSFFANRFWTFGKITRVTLFEGIGFSLVIASGLAINNSVLYLLVDVFFVNDLFAKIISTAVNSLWNFLNIRKWVFSK